MGLESDVRAFHENARRWFEIMWAAGFPAGVFEYERTPARQDSLYRIGRTNARAWESPHQYGLAFDYNFGKYGWQVPVWWWEYGDAVANYCGLRSGLAFKDANHIEDPQWSQHKRSSWYSRFFS